MRILSRLAPLLFSAAACGGSGANELNAVTHRISRDTERATASAVANATKCRGTIFENQPHLRLPLGYRPVSAALSCETSSMREPIDCYATYDPKSFTPETGDESVDTSIACNRPYGVESAHMVGVGTATEVAFFRDADSDVTCVKSLTHEGFDCQDKIAGESFSVESRRMEALQAKISAQAKKLIETAESLDGKGALAAAADTVDRVMRFQNCDVEADKASGAVTVHCPSEEVYCDLNGDRDSEGLRCADRNHTGLLLDLARELPPVMESDASPERSVLDCVPKDNAWSCDLKIGASSGTITIPEAGVRAARDRLFLKRTELLGIYGK